MKADFSEEIRLIKSGDQEQLKKIYIDYRSSFVAWASAKFQMDESDATDIYQEIIIAFYENVMAGKIIQLRSHIRTYLFGIGRLMILQHLRQAKRTDNPNELNGETGEKEWRQIVANYPLELSEREAILRDAIGKLGESCKEVLILFYYRRFTTEAIRDKMNFKNTDVVKSQKHRCIQQLRKQITSTFEKDQL